VVGVVVSYNTSKKSKPLFSFEKTEEIVEKKGTGA
jgi:hypothetical protein